MDHTQDEMLESPPERRDEQFGSYRIDLCPGNHGYIQANKWKPQSDGEDWKHLGMGRRISAMRL